jgi:branched-chain amino acid aminotransferase
MTTVSEIKVTRTKASRLSQVNFDDLPFGKVFSDHMLVADFPKRMAAGKSFPTGRSTVPRCDGAHYGQSSSRDEGPPERRGNPCSSARAKTSCA